MELVLVFIIMMIISSLLRGLRGPARTVDRGRPSAPPLSPPFFPEKGEARGWEPVLEEKKKFEFPLYSSHRSKSEQPARRKAEGKRNLPMAVIEKEQGVPLIKEGDNNIKELKELVTGRKLPLIVVASEIFAAPRSRVPFRSRKRF